MTYASNVVFPPLFDQDSLHGSPHLADGPTLTLDAVSRQDSGTYRCYADNGIREPVFVDMQLIVLCEF